MRPVLFTFFIFVAFMTPASADDIAVIVNGQVVSDYDVGQRAKLLSLSGKAVARATAVQELIDERLKMQEAEKLKLSVPDAQVDRAFEGIAQRSKMSAETFTQAMRSRGVEALTLKNRLRAEIAWQQVIRAKARVVMNIREQDIIDAMKKKGQDPDNIKTYEFSVMQAMVFVPKGGAAGDARARAESFRAGAKGCDAARQKATTLKDAAVREPVRRNGNELNPAMKEMLEKLPVGGATPVNQTEKGYEFMVLCDKKAIEGGDSAKATTRTELMVKEVGQASDRLLREVREKATIDYRKK